MNKELSKHTDTARLLYAERLRARAHTVCVHDKWKQPKLFSFLAIWPETWWAIFSGYLNWEIFTLAHTQLPTVSIGRRRSAPLADLMANARMRHPKNKICLKFTSDRWHFRNKMPTGTIPDRQTPYLGQLGRGKQRRTTKKKRNSNEISLFAPIWISNLEILPKRIPNKNRITMSPRTFDDCGRNFLLFYFSLMVCCRLWFAAVESHDNLCAFRFRYSHLVHTRPINCPLTGAMSHRNGLIRGKYVDGMHKVLHGLIRIRMYSDPDHPNQH